MGTEEVENFEAMKFTDEELLEEYDDMPEFRNTLEAWLTPRKPICHEEKTRREENHDQFTDYDVISTTF